MKPVKHKYEMLLADIGLAVVHKNQPIQKCPSPKI
jgi:hypothetical protein